MGKSINAVEKGKELILKKQVTKNSIAKAHKENQQTSPKKINQLGEIKFKIFFSLSLSRLRYIYETARNKSAQKTIEQKDDVPEREKTMPNNIRNPAPIVEPKLKINSV